jgi:methylglutaconyl-CoA hydratase
VIRIERHEQPRFAGVAELVIDRPAKRNALTPQMLDELNRAALELSADQSVRAILLRGEGTAFCAGFDLSLCVQSSEPLAAMLTGLSVLIRTLRRSPKPVVIAAHGAAIAGGCALLGAGDLVITDQYAKLGYPVVKLGISPAVSAPSLALAVQGRCARERLLDPALISGIEAARIGLVSRCVDLVEDVLPRAQIEAATLGEKPPHAFAATKRWLATIEGADHDAAFDAALSASLALVGGPEERARLAPLWTDTPSKEKPA